MLELNPDTVCFIISKAHEFQTQDQVSFPDEASEVGDEWPTEFRAEHQNDVAYQELKATIDDLEPDQQISLVALMWLGRGDFASDEWEAAVEQAKDSWNERTSDYLISTPLVADYLEEGLSQLGYSCE